MALHGTIQDFGLPDILQLIGIQRKTGVLKLDHGGDTVTLSFLEGQVVGAETAKIPLEDRLGEVLVRREVITRGQLDEALRTQKSTLQRLGHILVKSGVISEEELVEALMVQSNQIIYRLFRWREGRYHFDRVENLDYDSKHFVPISAETILMEGARMTDEWPMIERRVRSDKMVLRKTEKASLVAMEDVAAVVDDLDLALDFDAAGDGAEPAPAREKPDDGRIELGADEHQVLQMVDGARSVREICDLVPMGEFDTFRILADMMTKQLVERVPEERSKATVRKGPGWASRVVVGLASVALGLAVLGGLASLPSQPFTPWGLLEQSGATQQFRLYASMSRLERLEKAVRVFYLDTGSFPQEAAALASGGYVKPGELVDPWGRPYVYRISAGGYQFLGLDAEGQAAPELTVSRRFNPVQRLMFSGAADPDPDPAE